MIIYALFFQITVASMKANMSDDKIYFFMKHKVVDTGGTRLS
jgi:hypothetical protein